MSWFCLAWFGLVKLWYWVMAAPKNHFNWSKIVKLKVWFLGLGEEFWNTLHEAVGIFFYFTSVYINQGSQAEQYQTKPGHFRPFFRPFWPTFWAKIPKSKWIWFWDTYPLNKWGILSWKILVSPFGQFKKHHFCSAEMCLQGVPKKIRLSQVFPGMKA